MKHQKKLHLCPFGQTHRPKRQRKQRFQLPTELAAVLQPHSKVSRVGGRNGLCGSTGLVSFLGHLHVTICYIYLRTSCTSCLLTMEAANEESDKSPGTDLHKLLACGLMDTDAQAGVTNPGKRFAMSKTHGTIVLKYSFGDRDGFVRACQSYVSAVKARVAVAECEESMVDAAARVYCFCAAGSQASPATQVSVQQKTSSGRPNHPVWNLSKSCCCYLSCKHRGIHTI